jgi:hypothetical protein
MTFSWKSCKCHAQTEGILQIVIPTLSMLYRFMRTRGLPRIVALPTLLH